MIRSVIYYVSVQLEWQHVLLHCEKLLMTLELWLCKGPCYGEVPCSFSWKLCCVYIVIRFRLVLYTVGELTTIKLLIIYSYLNNNRWRGKLKAKRKCWENGGISLVDIRSKIGKKWMQMSHNCGSTEISVGRHTQWWFPQTSYQQNDFRSASSEWLATNLMVQIIVSDAKIAAATTGGFQSRIRPEVKESISTIND